jgi:hypothetical protein
MTFAEEIERRREELIAKLVEVAPPAPGVSEAESTQMIAGYLHLLSAASRGDTKPRDEYLSTVIPGVKQAGMKLGYIVRVLVKLDLTLVQLISPDHRPWMTNHCADYAERLASAWESA